MAMACERLFDLHRREFDHRQSKPAQGHDHDPTGLHHRNGVARAIEKEFLDRRKLRPLHPDELTEIPCDLHHALPFRSTGICADDSAVEHGLLTPLVSITP